MKNLLKKEFGFTAIPLTYCFLAASLMTFLPGYPILMGSFFVCLGIFYTFQIAREGNDPLYTTLLPVKKTDVVRARFIFVATVEMIAFAVMAAVTALRMTVLADAGPYVNNTLMNANIFYLGSALLIFAAFNFFFAASYWKDAYSVGGPFIRAGAVMLVIISAGEAAHFIPGYEALNTPFGLMGIQACVFAAGLAVYTVVTMISCRISMKRFERLDLHL